MKLKLSMLIISLMMIYVQPSWGAVENLDEVAARKARLSSATFFSGEDPDDHYIWQPMTLCYTDQDTGHEVWRMSSTKGQATGGQVYHSNMNGHIWSADGKRLAFYSFELDTEAYNRTVSRIWFLEDSDGKYLRPLGVNAGDSPMREQWDSKFPYFHWSPVLPDVFYDIGSTASGNSGVSTNILYKATVKDAGVSCEPWFSLPSDTYGIHHGISSDGKRILIMNNGETRLFPGTIYPEGEKGLDHASGYSLNRSHSTYWGDTPSALSVHGRGLWLLGDGTWFTFLPSGSHSHWRFKTIGSNVDGGSIYNHDTTYPYNFGGEAEPINSNFDNRNDPWCDAPAAAGYDCANYMGHMTYDRWGKKAAYSNTSGTGHGAVYDLNSHTYDIEDSGINHHYSDWSAWSDYLLGHVDPRTYLVKYNVPHSAEKIVNTHEFFNGGSLYGSYISKADPGQSPDGTKVAFNSDFLNNRQYANDIFWAVAYYPYPPEVISCTATGGTVKVRFDWRLNQANSRGYTTRGWPNETTDVPPPPREIKKFRLWMSIDKSTWIPVMTAAHNIVNRYDFSEGTWGGNSYWEITDSPGNGTFYYAVTSVEWSGIESRTLSNIYSITVSGGNGAGSQDIAYPSSPGDLDNISTSDFYTSFNTNHTDLIRYYNIYAEDGSTPSVSQRNRITSISANYCSDGNCSWVDWLGNTSGNTKYAVTAVDTQGNESDSNYVTNVSYSHRKSPATAQGQYTIEWDAMVAGNGGGIAPPSGLKLVPQPQ